MKQSIARPGTILTTIAVQVLLAGSVAHSSPIRIRPLEDSITDSANVAGGYRGPLYTLLTNLGFQVDFVGTQKNNGIGGLPDFDHEAHSGYRIDQIDGGLLGYFGQISDPDVILLLIGMNDYGQGYDTLDVTNRLEALLTRITTFRPFAKVIAAKLLE